MDNMCNKCGKPYTYVGDVPPGGFNTGDEPWCTCSVTTTTPNTGTGYVHVEPGIMYGNWCVICWPDKKTPAEYIWMGQSMCPECMKNCRLQK